MARRLTQCERILQILKLAKGGWVNGRYFVQEMMISQYHARIFELQKAGYKIEASNFTDEYGFKSYRLKPEIPEFPEPTKDELIMEKLYSEDMQLA